MKKQKTKIYQYEVVLIANDIINPKTNIYDYVEGEIMLRYQTNHPYSITKKLIKKYKKTNMVKCILLRNNFDKISASQFEFERINNKLQYTDNAGHLIPIRTIIRDVQSHYKKFN